MAIITEQEVKQAFRTAPEHVKEFINSNETYNTFESIRATHNLHVDQAGNLAMLINAVLLEMHPLNSFPQLLKDALGHGVDGKTFEGVLRDVNEKIFVAFRAKTKARADAAAQPTPAPKQTPAASPAPIKQISVLEQKMSETVAPVIMVQKIPPPTPQPAAGAPAATAPTAPTTPPPPTAPTRYHGTDPYRELPE